MTFYLEDITIYYNNLNKLLFHEIHELDAHRGGTNFVGKKYTP